MMKRSGLIFLLLSGHVLVRHLQADGLIRRFHAVSQRSTWTDARRYCRAKFTDLATIEDSTSNEDTRRTLWSDLFWIGLYFSPWKWSQEDQNISMKTAFQSWADGEPTSGTCVTISGLGRWTTADCNAKHHMICYNAEYNQNILVTEPVSWTEAQSYCRTRYTDLSSIHSLEDNQEVSRLLQSVTSSVGGGTDGTGGGTDGTGGGGGTDGTGGGAATGGGDKDERRGTKSRSLEDNELISSLDQSLKPSGRWWQWPWGGGGGDGEGSAAGGSSAGGSDAGGSSTGGSDGEGSSAGGSSTGGSAAGGSSTGGSDAGGSSAGGSDAGGSDGEGSSAGGSDTGGSDAGGNAAGGSSAGGSDAGGSAAGGSSAGGSSAGGSDAGDSAAGGSSAGGSAAGGSSAGGSDAGGSAAGGSSAGGSSAGGSDAGDSAAGGSSAGGSAAGGSSAGGSAAGGSDAGGSDAGGLVHAWIGLSRNTWSWSDQSGASFRRWAALQADGGCVATDSSGVWFSRSCAEKHSLLCHTDVRLAALRTLKLRLSGGSADLNDPAVRDGVLQQLRQKLEDGGIGEDVKLRWSRRPDGKVFHREEEEGAPPAGPEEEDV